MLVVAILKKGFYHHVAFSYSKSIFDLSTEARNRCEIACVIIFDKLGVIGFDTLGSVASATDACNAEIL